MPNHLLRSSVLLPSCSCFICTPYAAGCHSFVLPTIPTATGHAAFASRNVRSRVVAEAASPGVTMVATPDRVSTSQAAAAAAFDPTGGPNAPLRVNNEGNVSWAWFSIRVPSFLPPALALRPLHMSNTPCNRETDSLRIVIFEPVMASFFFTGYGLLRRICCAFQQECSTPSRFFQSPQQFSSCRDKEK